MPYDQAASYDESVKTPLVAASAGGWKTLANINLAAEIAADWKAGSHTLNGAALTFDRPANATTMGPDGTGVVLATDATPADWTNTARAAPTWSVGLQDVAGVDLAAYRKLAVMLTCVPTTLATNFSYWGLALETAAQAASAVALRNRMETGYNAKQNSLRGGSATSGGATGLASMPQSTMMVIDWNNKTLASYYDLLLRTTAPSPADPSADGWTQMGYDEGMGHLLAEGGSYSLATLRLVAFLGGWAAAIKSGLFKLLVIQGLL